MSAVICPRMLPSLRGRSPLHAGSGPGLANIRQGQRNGGAKVSADDFEKPVHFPPFVGVNYVIALQGIYPSRP